MPQFPYGNWEVVSVYKQHGRYREVLLKHSISKEAAIQLKNQRQQAVPNHHYVARLMKGM